MKIARKHIENVLGGKVVGEEYKPLGNTQFGSVINKIRLKKPDVIYAAVVGGSNVAWFKQLKAAGITSKKQTLLTISVTEDEVLGIGGENLEGFYSIMKYFQSQDNANNKAFVAAFKEMWGKDSVIGDVTQAAQMSAGITAEELKDRLKRLQLDGKPPVIHGCLDVGMSSGINGGGMMQGITVADALKRTLLDNTTALRLLEAQACTGGLIDAEGNRCSLQEAVKKGLIDQKQINRLIDAERSYAGFNCDRSGKRLSVAEALKKGMITYDMGTRLMEYQVATGGLINPTTKTRVEVEEAVKIGWIDQKRANRLSDPSRSTRQIVSPTTGLLISYFDALMTSIPDKHNNLQLEALPKAERELRVGNAQIKAYSCASSVVSSIAASSFGDFSTPGQTVNMGFF